MIEPGQTLGLVGESGSGKSTIGSVLLGLSNAEAEARIQAALAEAGMASDVVERMTSTTTVRLTR